METTSPGKTTIITESGIPTGSSVGFQVIKTTTGSVAIGRTTLGVVERPTGSGNFVITFIAPPEGDLYIVLLDWNAGVIEPTTSRPVDLLVTSSPELGSSGMGAIADYTKVHLGGETWRALTTSNDYGANFVARAIDVVKHRVMTTPPIVDDEDTLPAVVLDYMGILCALQLITPGRDYWASQAMSVTRGDDASETVTYANRTTMMNELRDDLMRLLPAAQAAALPLIVGPVLIKNTGPAIDEIDDSRVTEDPRKFPNERDFPVRRLPTGVRL